MPSNKAQILLSKDEARAYLVPALNAARDLAVRGGMHFHFLSELDHLIATAQANTGDGNGLCQDPGNVIDLLAPGLCAVQAQLDENGLSGDVLAGMLSTDLCSMIDPI